MKPEIAILGAGYVGMPLAHVFAGRGKAVVLVDVNRQVVDAINRGESHIDDVPSGALQKLVDDGRIAATTEYDALKDADAILVALPTPLTSERLQPILERSGLKAGKDFHLAFSPERVDPGRTDWTTRNTPKLVGGVTPACTERAAELYRATVETVVPVSSPEAA